MFWVAFGASLVVTALMAWGIVGIATSEMPAKRAPERSPPTRGIALPPTASVATIGDQVCIHCDLSGAAAGDVLAELKELLEHEEALAKQLRDDGNVRVAKLHTALADGIREHLEGR